VTDHNHRAAHIGQRLHGLQNMMNHRGAGNRLKHLRQRRMHPFTESRGKNNNVNHNTIPFSGFTPFV